MIIAKTCLVVQEWKTSDQVIQSIKAGFHEVLRVVAEELKNGKHSKSSVLKFLKSTFLFFSFKVGLSNIEISKPSTHVYRTNGKDNLSPAKSRDGIDCGNAIGNVGAGNSWGDIKSPAEEFGDNIANNSKLCNTTVYARFTNAEIMLVKPER